MDLRAPAKGRHKHDGCVEKARCGHAPLVRLASSFTTGLRSHTRDKETRGRRGRLRGTLGASEAVNQSSPVMMDVADASKPADDSGRDRRRRRQRQPLAGVAAAATTTGGYAVDEIVTREGPPFIRRKRANGSAAMALQEPLAGAVS